jgi:hypothetical protein
MSQSIIIIIIRTYMLSFDKARMKGDFCRSSVQRSSFCNKWDISIASSSSNSPSGQSLMALLASMSVVFLAMGQFPPGIDFD